MWCDLFVVFKVDVYSQVSIEQKCYKLFRHVACEHWRTAMPRVCVCVCVCVLVFGAWRRATRNSLIAFYMFVLFLLILYGTF